MKYLSVIIPTYNMEKYLHRCLDSLLIKDNFNSLEVWVVNDGSKDSSSDIAHEYETKYPNVFHVLDKSNGNYGSCINAALPLCTGKYIKVLDADDWFDSAEFEKMLGRLEFIDVDLVLTNMTYVYGTGHKRIYNYPFYTPIVQNTKIMLHLGFKLMHMHSIAYKTSLLKNMKYRQTEGISYTDTEWCYYPMCHVNTISCLDLNVYQYLLGRIGQTSDENTMVKDISHSATIAQKMILFYGREYFINTNDREHKEYIKFRLFIFLKALYKQALLSMPYDSSTEIIDEIENCLKVNARDIYDELGSLPIHAKLPFKFVKFYRLKKSRPSVFVCKIYKWLKILQYYLESH